MIADEIKADGCSVGSTRPDELRSFTAAEREQPGPAALSWNFSRTRSAEEYEIADGYVQASFFGSGGRQTPDRAKVRRSNSKEQ
jgi:hypothetical protein